MDKAENNYKHILKYTSIFGGVQGLNILIGLVRNKLVAVILGPQGMGLMALFNSSVRLIYDSTNLGIPVSAVKNISQAYDSGDEAAVKKYVQVVRSWTFLTALLGTLLCAIASPLFNNLSFTWGDHTLHYLLLSPIVGMTAITGGETAILKGVRRLRDLATIQVATVISALVTSVPLYYYFGEPAIVPSLIIIALASMIITIVYSFRLYRPEWKIRKGDLGMGRSMIVLGIAFVIAGVLGSGADFAIRSFVSHTADLDTVGLYNAGFMMTMTYGGMVFSAMETDYFPRLSSQFANRHVRNNIINQQIEVSLLLISPMLTWFMICLPILLPLLYSGKFLPVIGMMQAIVFAMLMRAAKLPVAYIALAAGDSKSYLIIETTYYLFLIAAVMIGFSGWGLDGAGWAITITGIFDILQVYIYYSIRYKYRPTNRLFYYLSLQLPLLIAAYLITKTDDAFLYWGLGIAVALISTIVSVRLYMKLR